MQVIPSHLTRVREAALVTGALEASIRGSFHGACVPKLGLVGAGYIYGSEAAEEFRDTLTKVVSGLTPGLSCLSDDDEVIIVLTNSSPVSTLVVRARKRDAANPAAWQWYVGR